MGKIKQCSRLEERSLIRVLVPEKCKLREIFIRGYDVYGEESLVKKLFSNELNMGLP